MITKNKTRQPVKIGAKANTKNTKNPKKEPKTVDTVTAGNAFASAADALGVGLETLFADAGAQYSLIPLDMIEVKAQIREIFEDDENSLDDLAASIKTRGVLQPILVRPSASGYELVAGERRFRASSIAGLDQIPAYIREMTDEQAEDAQMAENIHRKNLTQIEEAKKIQRDLDRLGSIEAVLDKHSKSRAWFSKMMALLRLPEQAKRLVTENVSADVELIHTVKTIEKADPQAAKALVDDLKKTRGQANARDKAAAVKEKVKPGKKDKGEKTPGNRAGGGTVATPKDRSHEAPGPVSVAAGETAKTDGKTTPPQSARVLYTAYGDVFERDSKPQTVLDNMAPEDREAADELMRTFYEAGVQAKEIGRTVIQGLRNGQFAADGDAALALVAFLQGAERETQYSLLNVLGSVKA